ncbi:MAG: PIN domain-containing protein, partial [Sulfolobales archaeon]
PTSGLDVESARLLREKVNQYNRDGKTVFLSTHNMEEANQLCHRIAIINHGKIAAIDTATTIKDLATRGVIKTIKFTKLDFSNTLQIAHKEGITFYDASYIATARNAEATLVTEDEKLKKAASKFIKTITYSDLESKLTQT